MRSDKKLLELLLDNIKLVETEGGLCIVAIELRMRGEISLEEEVAIDGYIHKNGPKSIGSTGWKWPSCKVAPRRKWLKQQIKSL